MGRPNPQSTRRCKWIGWKSVHSGFLTRASDWLKISVFHKQLWDCNAEGPLPCSEKHWSGLRFLPQIGELKLWGRKLGESHADGCVPSDTRPSSPAFLAPSSLPPPMLSLHILRARGLQNEWTDEWISKACVLIAQIYSLVVKLRDACGSCRNSASNRIFWVQSGGEAGGQSTKDQISTPQNGQGYQKHRKSKKLWRLRAT